MAVRESHAEQPDYTRWILHRFFTMPEMGQAWLVCTRLEVQRYVMGGRPMQERIVARYENGVEVGEDG
tara:strand:- start:2957 stop:3160 length:204 start_codon:yes stop_codon:yes gene_type:complete